MVWERAFSVAPERLWDTMATKEGLSLWRNNHKFGGSIPSRGAGFAATDPR